MRNYVEELKGKDILTAVVEVQMLYEKSGGDKSPLFPLLNYAAMCALKKGAETDDYEECKQKGIECMKGYVKCPTVCEGSHTNIEASFLSYNKDGSVTVTPFTAEIPFHEDKLVTYEPKNKTSTVSGEDIDKHAVRWAANLLRMMTVETGKQLDKYTERLSTFPSFEDVKNTMTDADEQHDGEQLTIGDVENKLHHGKMSGTHAYKLSESTEPDRTKNNGYLIAISDNKTVQTILVMGKALQYTMKKHGHFEPKGAHTRSITPLTPQEKEQAEQAYGNSLGRNKEALEAIKQQRQKLLGICGLKEGINEHDIF